MKKILITFGLVSIGYCFAQNQREYGPWQTVYEETEGDKMLKVEISFSLSECNSNNTMIASSRYRTRNAIVKDNRVSFKFRFIDCDNKTRSEKVYVDLNKQGITEDKVYYFYGKSVTGIEGVKLDFITKAENKKNNGNDVIIESVPDKEGEGKVVVVDGKWVEKKTEDKKPDDKLTKSFGRTKQLIKKNDKSNDKVYKIKAQKSIGGVRGENTNPKVESIAITEEKTEPKKKQTTSKKK